MRKESKQENTIRVGDPIVGKMNGLDNNLSASAKGVILPIIEGLLGPFRSIIYAKTLRSIRVKKATATNNISVERHDATHLLA